jgi:mycothiol synthase
MEFRRPVLEEAIAVATIINECTTEDVGMAVYTGDELQDPERLDDFEIAVEGRRMDAVLEYETDRHAPELYFEGFVRREARARGVYGDLVERAGGRAGMLATETGRDVKLLTNVVNDAARVVLEERGFEQVHFEYAMWMDLSEQTIHHEHVDGLELVPYMEGRDDRTMWRVMREGFGDDWEEGRPTELEPWILSHSRSPTYDPSLWFLAHLDGRLVGGIMGRSWWGAQHDVGHVKNLAVLPSARRRGVGRALLLHIAALFHERGRTAMVLGVDGDNHTRARGFYERVGMRTRAATYDYAVRIGPDRA